MARKPSAGTIHPVPSLDQAIERLYDLNVGTTPVEEGPPHERPHKPLLLLAVFDLIDEGLATPYRVPWCRELRDRFKARFDVVREHNDQCNPDLPFRYLAGDGFWQALERGRGIAGVDGTKGPSSERQGFPPCPLQLGMALLPSHRLIFEFPCPL